MATPHRDHLSAPHLERRREVLMAVPARWRRRDDVADGVLVAARADRLPASGLRPEIALRYEPVGARDLATWQHHALASLGRRLRSLTVEEHRPPGPDGPPVVFRRYAHRVATPPGAATSSLEVVVDHWAWICGGMGLTLSCAAARPDHPDLRDLFAAVAATVEVVPALPSAS